MCGIALIISSLQIDLSAILPHFKFPKSQSQQVHHLNVSVEDIKEVLLRRGPNNLGSWNLHIRLKTRSNADTEDYCLCNVDDATKRVKSCLCFSEKKNDCITSEIEVLQNDDIDDVLNSVAELHFIGATLQLRGTDPVLQPLVDDLGNVLVYNGEIFGGIQIDNISNDAEILMHALGRCSSCDHSEYNAGNICVEEGQISVLGLLSMVKGPWALIYWQSHSKTLWFGRDAFGRRSLLVHWPTSEDPRFLLSSVSPPSSIKKSSDSEAENGTQDLDFWEELPCGVYSLKLDDSKLSGSFVGEVRKHEWTNPALKELIKWERISVECNTHEINTVRLSSKSVQNIVKSTSSNGIQSPSEVALVNGITTCKVSLPALKVLIALKESVTQRTIINPIMENKPVPVAVLFSGGLDSMILAALLDECLDPRYEIDLLNVSFDGQFAPDRISARAGMKELQNISPSRRWNLVEIDADLSNLITETEHVMSLISPSRTYMDLNIGIALWLAAGGDGWVYTNSERVKYKSEARILLVGSGADEQCAGYSRHRTKFRLGGWVGLHEEMKLDMQRIWKRNLGRDDRCISDTGKEARFPFLDEDVIKTLLEIPLCQVADLNLPVGKGDKKILREVAQLLGFKEAAFLPKRAIQFGSRIARESNRKNFGSNRAANQASAGSVVIPSTI